MLALGSQRDNSCAVREINMGRVDRDQISRHFADTEALFRAATSRSSSNSMSESKRRVSVISGSHCNSFASEEKRHWQPTKSENTSFFQICSPEQTAFQSVGFRKVS
jgi:hypothetical protein